MGIMQPSFLKKRRIKKELNSLGNLFQRPPYPHFMITREILDLIFDIMPSSMDDKPNAINETALWSFVKKIEKHLGISGYITTLDTKTQTSSDLSTAWAKGNFSISILNHTLTVCIGRWILDSGEVVLNIGELEFVSCLYRKFGELLLTQLGISTPTTFSIDMCTVFCGLGGEGSTNDGIYIVFDPASPTKKKPVKYALDRASMEEYMYARTLCKN